MVRLLEPMHKLMMLLLCFCEFWCRYGFGGTTLRRNTTSSIERTTLANAKRHETKQLNTSALQGLAQGLPPQEMALQCKVGGRPIWIAASCRTHANQQASRNDWPPYSYLAWPTQSEPQDRWQSASATANKGVGHNDWLCNITNTNKSRNSSCTI